jgi:hypothetical protein
MIEKSHRNGFFYLGEIALLELTTIRRQDWKDVEIKGFVDKDVVDWERFIVSLS